MVGRAAMVGGIDYYVANPEGQAGEEERQVPAPPTSKSAVDPIEQLKELSELREHGILTEEEFTAEKRKLLGS
jgi:hypothetical protein